MLRHDGVLQNARVGFAGGLHGSTENVSTNEDACVLGIIGGWSAREGDDGRCGLNESFGCCRD